LFTDSAAFDPAWRAVPVAREMIPCFAEDPLPCWLWPERFALWDDPLLREPALPPLRPPCDAAPLARPPRALLGLDFDAVDFAGALRALEPFELEDRPPLALVPDDFPPEERALEEPF